MTPFEEFIAQHWWSIGGVAALAIGLFVKFGILQKSVDDHHSPSNLNPHPNCALHTTMLASMDKKLDKIDTRMDTLFENFMSSSYKKDD